MKKTFLLQILTVAFVLSQGFSALAQGVISGKVTEKSSGDPLIGAAVSTGNGTGILVDIDGNYSINVSTATAQVKVTFTGYSTQTKTVTVSGNQTVNFELTEDLMNLDEVVVTATFGTKSQKDSPLSMTYLSAKQVANLAANSQADVLRTIPGITAEGGGGEVASNIFIRGLPSGGQYQFNPLQVDGLPTLSTFGLNSSAHDVYFRNDIGIQSLEFVRGGVSTLFGAGSVAGIINYNSITGSDVSKNAVQLEWATLGRVKADFLSSGKLGGSDSKTYYALSGFYRYDEGPIKTGLPTEGVQIRGNIKRLLNNGSVTIMGQYIDDKAQFYLPFPLNAADKSRPTVGGETVRTMQTVNAADFTFNTPDGVYNSPIRDGVTAKGGYIMMKANQNFGDGWAFDSKIKYAKYDHQFNLFLDGAGFGNPVETQSTFLATAGRGLTGATNLAYTYVDNGKALPSNALLFENRVLDRSRPLNEYVGEFNLSKSIANHNITLGTFLSRSEAGDVNITYRYLSEFADNPRLVNLSYTDANGVAKKYALNGLTGTNVGYSNQSINSNKAAVYIAEEFKGEKFNLDAGIRIEKAMGEIRSYGSKAYTMQTDPTLAPNISTVSWNNNVLTKKGTVSTTGTAIALAGLYKVSQSLNVYANFSKGYFFPELRSVKFKSAYETSTYKPENIVSAEAGVKYGSSKFAATAAIYNIALSDRNEINFINDGQGGLIDDIQKVSTASRGIEASLNYNIAKNLNASGNFTYQLHEYTKYESNAELVGNWLQRQPRTMGMIALNYDNSVVDAGFSTNYIGKKYTAADNVYELDAYTISRLDAGYTVNVGEGTQKMRFGVSVFNLFDTAGITEGSPRGANIEGSSYFVGRPELPRRIFLRARFDF
ncbi:MAG: TonB-dependent receptor [Spirosomaceae bacterium]|nr:TonB-dependent receptor [Spirosomataceae bacterium]